MEKRRKRAYNAGRSFGGWKLRFAVVLMMGFVWGQQVELDIPGPPEQRSPLPTEEALLALFDRQQEEIRVVLAIDRSASMRDAWEAVLASAKEAVSELPENACFGLVLFSAACEGGAVLWRKELVAATAQAKGEAIRWLDAWRPAGCSTLLEAVKAAFSLGTEISVFLAADGLPNAGTTTDTETVAEESVRLVAARRGRLNTILVGLNGEAAELLAELAHRCRGRFSLFLVR